MKSILEGTGLVIDRFYRLEEVESKAPHYQHKGSCLLLSKHPRLVRDSLPLLVDLYQTIKTNWQASRAEYGKPPSRQNWRMTRRPNLSAHNKRPEVSLERHIIQATDESWMNQIPTSSGLTDSAHNKARNLDLIHNLGDGAWEFIELKVNSDTPLYAAMEIVQYGLVFLFSRHHQEELGYDTAKDLLQAIRIHLKVLAPASYYLCNRAGAQYQLQWLEESLNDGLRRLGDSGHTTPFHLDFQFEAFPSSFTWPPANGAADHETLRTALRNRQPVYAHRALTVPAR